jgi:hypothetical protein
MIPLTSYHLTVIFHKAILRLCCLPAGMIGLFATPLPAQQDSLTQIPITQLRAPDVSRWEVIIQHRDTPEVAALEEARSGPRLTSEVIEKDKTFYRVLRRYSDRKQDEFWVTPHIQFHRPAGKSEVIRLLPGDGSAVDFSESDFQELYCLPFVSRCQKPAARAFRVAGRAASLPFFQPRRPGQCHATGFQRGDAPMAAGVLTSRPPAQRPEDPQSQRRSMRVA